MTVAASRAEMKKGENLVEGSRPIFIFILENLSPVEIDKPGCVAMQNTLLELSVVLNISGMEIND